ncbi:MAG: hypothetical protein QM831_16270 [Kofleriaceae bacterium]
MIGSLAVASTAIAQPVEPPIDQPPPVEAAPAPVIAVDGQARNFEQAPEQEHVVGSSIIGGIGVGVSWIVRVIEAPFRGAMYLEARYQIVQTVKDVLTNDAGTIGVYPDASFETAFGASIGAHAFFKKLWDDNDSVTISAKTGGAYRYAAEAKLDNPRVGNGPMYLKARVRFEDNTNLFFGGIGNNPYIQGMNLSVFDSSFGTRFSQKRFLTSLGAGVDLGNHVKLGGTAIYNHRTFGPAADGSSDPSIETVYNTATLPGFDKGFDDLELTADLEVDTRDVPGPAQHGFLGRAFGGWGSIVDHPTYGHYGAELMYFITPWLPERTFVVRGVLEGIRDNNDDVPFTELPRLGGAAFLRGYLTDQFRDKIATVGTIEYRYPIHHMLEGALFVDVGKVGRTLDAVYGTKDDWHFGYGGAFILHTKTSNLIRLDVAWGDGLNFYFVTDVLDAFRNREREL